MFIWKSFPNTLKFMKNTDKIRHEVTEEKTYDLFIALDCGDMGRLGFSAVLFKKAAVRFCVDHHVSHKSFADQNYIRPDASSTSELIYDLLDYGKMSVETAECLYTGMVHDTGVFRYSSTTQKTMEIAGSLMEKGIPFWKYIDECFYQRTYTQTQLLGRTLLTSMRLMDGKVIVATVTRRMLEFYGAQTEDIEGIIDQLRVTKGVEVALLLHEIGDQEYKVSMRSNTTIDVSRIAVYFGGGGHVKAAGCTMRGSLHDVVNNITEHIEFQM